MDIFSEVTSLDNASKTKIKSSGLKTESCCTPTLTSNSSLYKQFTVILLFASLYIARKMATNYSGTPTILVAHHSTLHAGPILESKGTHAIFQKKTKKRAKKGKNLQIWAKMYKI